MRILCSTLAALALGAAPAAAAAPWSPPATLPGTQPLLVQGSGGPRAVYWNTYPPGLPTPTNFTTSVSLLGPGLLPGTPQVVSPSFQLGSGDLTAAAYGPAAVALPGQTTVATGPLIGPLRPHAFSKAVRGVAGDAAGDLAVVTSPCVSLGCIAGAPELVIARRGHGFGRPIRLDPKARGQRAAVAIDTYGRVLAAWDSRGSVYARFVTTRGKVRPIQRLGSAPYPTSIEAVYSADGRAAVGWTSQAVSEGDASSPFTATVALAGATQRFARPRVLSTVRVTGTGRYIPYQGLSVSLPAGQPGLAAWSGYDGAHYAVQAAPIDGTRVGGTQTVSQAGIDTVLADAAEGPRGQAVILMLPNRAGADPPSPGNQPHGLLAVSRPATGQAFGTAEEIVAGAVAAAGPPPVFIDGASVGIDAATSVAFATWHDVSGPIGWSVRAPLG